MTVYEKRIDERIMKYRRTRNGYPAKKAVTDMLIWKRALTDLIGLFDNADASIIEFYNVINEHTESMLKECYGKEKK